MGDGLKSLISMVIGGFIIALGQMAVVGIMGFWSTTFATITVGDYVMIQFWTYLVLVIGLVIIGIIILFSYATSET